LDIRNFDTRYVYQNFLCPKRNSSNPTNKKSNTSEKREGRTVYSRFKQLYFCNHSKTEACSYGLVFSQWPIVAPPKYWPSLLNHSVLLI
jgi:hypothetical protein